MTTRSTTTRPRNGRLGHRLTAAGLAAAIAATAAFVPVGQPHVGAAANDCGLTARLNSTFSYMGVKLFRHEARGSVCENNVSIVDVRPYENRMVKIGVGAIYRNETNDSKGFAPAKTSFDNLHAKVGMSFDVPFLGSIELERTRHVNIGWSMRDKSAVYTVSIKNW